MLNRWRRKTQLIALFSVLALLIAACGGGSGTNTSATAGSTGATAGATTTGGGTSQTAGPDAGAATATTGGAGGAATTATTGAGGAATTATTGAGGAATTATTGAGGGTSGGGAAPAAASCSATAKGAKVTMWSPLTGPDGEFMTKLASKFSSDNPQGVTVVHVAQPDYLQKLNTAAAGKNLPEMTVIREGDIAEMAARNIVKPISGEAATTLGLDNLKSDFPQQYWSVGEYKGQRYAIPLDGHPLVLYYNKDLFQKAGISAPPKTWQEFEQVADKLTQNGVMGAAIGTAFDGSTLFQTLLQQYGGTQTNQDATQATYNSEAGVKALTYLRDLRKKYSPNVSGTGDPEVTLFKQGKAAMVIHGPWHIAPLEQLKFTGFAPVPQQQSGGKQGVWGGSHQLALTTADATKQAAAACWMSWLSANSVQWAAAGQIPARNSVRSNNAELQKIAAPIAAIAEEAGYSIMPPGGVPGYSAAIFAQALEPAIDAVLLGRQQDVKQALDNAAAKSNQILKQNKQRYQ